MLEVGSVKEFVFPQDIAYAGPRACGAVIPKISGNRVTLSPVTLCGLITIAYGLQEFEIVGVPKWVNKKDWPIHYEVVAISSDPAPLSTESARVLLQEILADRFQMKFHQEMRELSVYALVVARNGPKFTESPPLNCTIRSDKTIEGFGFRLTVPASPNAPVETRPGSIISCRPTFSMADLAKILYQELDRPVLDKTKLTGGYTFELKWIDQSSLLAALQDKLGLRLDTTKEQVKVLVIDQVVAPGAN
jgi:uncharacterized protein (TIGR03435 family)